VFEKQLNLFLALVFLVSVDLDYCSVRKQRTTETGNTVNTNVFADENRGFGVAQDREYCGQKLWKQQSTPTNFLTRIGFTRLFNEHLQTD